MLRFRDLGVFVFDLGYFVFEFWVLRFRSRMLRFRVVGASFSRFGCFVLRSSFSSASFSKLPRKDKVSQSSSGCPMREAKNPQLEMAKQPQIKRRIQANISLFHFISLAEQSGHCNRRQVAVCFPKSKTKRRRRGEYIFTTTHDR